MQKLCTYKSSNPQVAVVNSSTGKVTAKKWRIQQRLQISTTARSGKICTKDVDVFMYMMDLMMSAVETSGSKTTLYI